MRLRTRPPNADACACQPNAALVSRTPTDASSSRAIVAVSPCDERQQIRQAAGADEVELAVGSLLQDGARLGVGG